MWRFLENYLSINDTSWVGCRGVARVVLRGYSPAALRFSPAAFCLELLVFKIDLRRNICFCVRFDFFPI